MSRPKPAPAPKRPTGTGGGGGDTADETCPVCKSSRYLNPSLRFLVNPECYHKMCESCVDRIFGHGPAQCPIAGCKRTLRKHRFREQTFEDIKVEREVDIRKRIATVFNKREEDFEDLRAWNDYLNEVEDVTFNLVEGLDVEESERRLEKYAKAHREEIEANARGGGGASYKELQKEERDAAKLRRAAARREEDEEKRAQLEDRKDLLQRLATGKEDAETVAKEGQKVQLKRRMDRQAAEERQRLLNAAPDESRNGSSSLVIKGLKARGPAPPEAPIDPFGGLSFEGRQYYSIQDHYVAESLQTHLRDPKLKAGGYNVFEQYTERALCEAFGGLGVFIGDEITVRDRVEEGPDVMATAKAGLGVQQDVKMEDPF
ncbi:hypothetical protein B0A48_10524 [Cryoendolithus antarcticus]|uniref:RNA polymerase II transcription factor B subunit 3 n=1 Tax=Cryoendolithus antarcticus TaxID=1507870 RepID=A0A1V8SXJ9_9PEZI|nr:hypothetical protein B0A48_10524 [Cryoendolithus antarcticus]